MGSNMMFSSCPICHLQVLSSELEWYWHADSHFADDDLQRDAELALHAAYAAGNPQISVPGDLYDFSGNNRWPEDQETSTSDNGRDISRGNGRDISRGNVPDEQTNHLVRVQVRSTMINVEGGLMNLMRSRLESEGNSSRSVIVSHVDHYQSIRSEDKGWGCGWRNIQMLSSYLLKERKAARDVLFGGAGFVPDIPSLQRWLEIAWENGFDVAGAEQFHSKIYSLRKWIGTTECAALLRSFGLRARIVDFDSLDTSQAPNKRMNNGKVVASKVHGPIDKFLVRNPDHPSTSSLQTEEISTVGPQVLVEWVWNYFAGRGSCRSDASANVTISDKTPLYFQHDGHSRTIVGIQKCSKKLPEQYSLLILDPGESTADIERALRSQNGWQKLIKRGVHTLKAPQYQLCYVDPGVASPAETEQLKTITSELIRF